MSRRVARTWMSGLVIIAIMASGSARSLQIGPGTSETVTDVVVHGNHSIPDDEILRLADIEIGKKLPGGGPGVIEKRLLDSGKLADVQVKKRYRSMTRLDEVTLIIVVTEKTPARKKVMFFPILAGSDEYGLSYGGQITAIDLFGAAETIKFPLTWGGYKRASALAEVPVTMLFFDTVTAGASIFRRENPHFEIDDDRVQFEAGLQKRVEQVQFNLDAGWRNVNFDDSDDTLLSVGASVTVDTRTDRLLPGNAVYASFGWEWTDIRDGGPDYNRFLLDLRGYGRVFGQAILAGQFLVHKSDSALPAYELPFLGGADTLRGHPPGEFVGDNLLLSSVELRWPLTSPLAIYRAGFTFFFDSGTVWNDGSSLNDADFRHGVGAGAFFFVVGLGFRVEVANDLGNNWRVHFSTHFRF